MTFPEWVEVNALIVALWPHARDLEPELIRLQHRIVVDVDQADAIAAVERASTSGADFPPTVGQIAKAARQEASGGAAAPWTAALALLRQAAGQFGARREADAIRWLAERSPHAARFAVEHGWAIWCREQLDDPDHGGAVAARLERSYGSVAAALDREVADGRILPRVAERLRALDAGATASSGGLRRLTALKALPPAPSEAA